MRLKIALSRKLPIFFHEQDRHLERTYACGKVTGTMFSPPKYSSFDPCQPISTILRKIALHTRGQKFHEKMTYISQLSHNTCSMDQCECLRPKTFFFKKNFFLIFATPLDGGVVLNVIDRSNFFVQQNGYRVFKD